jgi:uncharacterized protein YfeS
LRRETPPFGSDEGADELWDWSQRVEELRPGATLRYIIESGDDSVDAAAAMALLRQTDQPNIDDVTIGLGFVLLRYTGQIDPEGREWLIEALERQDRRYAGRGMTEYGLLLSDLQNFNSSPWEARPGP